MEPERRIDCGPFDQQFVEDLIDLAFSDALTDLDRAMLYCAGIEGGMDPLKLLRLKK